MMVELIKPVVGFNYPAASDDFKAKIKTLKNMEPVLVYINLVIGVVKIRKHYCFKCVGLEQHYNHLQSPLLTCGANNPLHCIHIIVKQRYL